MLNRLSFAAILVCCPFMHAAPSFGATLYAQLFSRTGEIRLLNKSAVPVPIVFYSIKSNSNALNGSSSVWKSITDTYDAPFGTTPGNGFVDPNAEWAELSATSMELTEAVFSGPGGNVLSWRPVNLGRIWNPNATPIPDLVFSAREPSEQPITVVPEYALDGDYFPDGVVNQTDYLIWRQYFGSTTILFADGNLNGIVDAADYVVWRNNLGLSIPSTSIGSAGSAASTVLSFANAAVPEPGCAALGVAALVFVGFATKRCARGR